MVSQHEIDRIKSEIKSAEKMNKKMAMFHYQVLIHATQLTVADAAPFCNAVGVPPSYKTEFCKMINLADLMKANGHCLALPPPCASHGKEQDNV